MIWLFYYYRLLILFFKIENPKIIENLEKNIEKNKYIYFNIGG
jgi:hypothetical protein